jgi:two-component system, sensor histidine kinase LadS
MLYRQIVHLALLLILFACIPALGQVSFYPDADKGAFQYQISYLRDENSNLNLADVLSTEVTAQFTPTDNKNLSFSFTDATLWVKISLQPGQLPDNNYLLRIGYALLDYVSVHFQDANGEWQVTQMGDMYPFHVRPVNHRHFMHPLALTSHTPTVYYLQVRTESAMIVPIDIQSTQHFFEQDLKAEVAYGIFYGILLVMILFNLFIFFSLRDINYLFYPISICGSLFYFVSLNGHMYQFVLGDYPWWANKLVIVAMGLLATASALFAKNFLDIKRYSLKLNAVLTIVLFSGVLIMALAFLLDYSSAVKIAAVLLLADAFALFYSGFYSWYKGNTAARFFVIGWFVYLGGAIAIIMRNFGLLPHNFFTSQAVEIGSAFEVIFLSLALSDKYRLLNMASKVNNENMLRLQQEANEMLERKVMERTAELNEQKDEIKSQRDSIERHSRILELINFEIERNSEKITSSIKYAKRIQEAILQNNRKISKALPQHFILYQPRDIVSGDFFWMSEVKAVHPISAATNATGLPGEEQMQESDKIVIAAVDCTGHGVPGAFMSLIGDALLQQIVNEKRITRPDLILNHMHTSVRNTLHQNESESRDGMDMALCVIDLQNRIIEYAGAKNPLYIFKEPHPGGKACLDVIQADRYSIGGNQFEEERFFKNHTIQLDTPATIYIFTDGYQDQFGGDKNKKFMVGRFKQLLASIYHLPMHEQKQILESTIQSWMGDNEQIDDILVMGIRL